MRWKRRKRPARPSSEDEAMTELAASRAQLERDRKKVIEPLERISRAMRDEDRVSQLIAELLAKGQGRRDPGAADH